MLAGADDAGDEGLGETVCHGGTSKTPRMSFSKCGLAVSQHVLVSSHPKGHEMTLRPSVFGTACDCPPTWNHPARWSPWSGWMSSLPSAPKSQTTSSITKRLTSTQTRTSTQVSRNWAGGSQGEDKVGCVFKLQVWVCCLFRPIREGESVGCY